jgi:hypothetical protein
MHDLFFCFLLAMLTRRRNQMSKLLLNIARRIFFSFILDPPLVWTKESEVNNTEQLYAIKREKNERKKKRKVAMARASLVCVKTTFVLGSASCTAWMKSSTGGASLILWTTRAAPSS